MNASELITDAARFQTGALAFDAFGLSCGTAPNSGAVKFDALGALLWCHRDEEKRAPVAKRVFDLCRARYDHARIGRLEHEEALELLRDAGA